MHVDLKIQKKEAALLRGEGRGSGRPPQAVECKGQQGIMNILNEKKSGLSALRKFYNKLLFGCVDCFITILFNFQTKYEGWNFNSGNYLFTTDTK